MSKKDDLARRNFLLAAAGVAGLPVIGGQLAAAEEEAAEQEAVYQKEKGQGQGGQAVRPPAPPQLAGTFHRLGQHQNHPWANLPWKGCFNKVLMYDRATGLTLELARIEKGSEFPEHYHPSVQTQFLVEGRVRLRDGRILTPGGFTIIPPGQLHGPFAALEDSVTFKYFSSTPVYLLPDGATYIYREDGTIIDAGNLNFMKQGKPENFIAPVR